MWCAFERYVFGGESIGHYRNSAGLAAKTAKILIILVSAYSYRLMNLCDAATPVIFLVYSFISIPVFSYTHILIFFFVM